VTDSRREVQPVVEVRALIRQLENQRDQLAIESMRTPVVHESGSLYLIKMQGMVAGYDTIIAYLNNLLTEERQGK
jgi:hypothetical protein